MELRESDPAIPAPPPSRRAAVKARVPRDRGRISAPPPSSAGARAKVPPVHMVSLVTTGQNWPLVPAPGGGAATKVSEAVEKAAARSPRMSIDVELDFDERAEGAPSSPLAARADVEAPAPLPPVLIRFDAPPSSSGAAEAPKMPVAPVPERSIALAKIPVVEPSIDLNPPIEPRRRTPLGVGLLCLLSIAGSIAIVALKLLP